MNYKNAKKIIEDTETDYDTKKNRLVLGMQIIAKYTESENYGLEHDQIWYGDFESTVEKMTEEEVKELATLGWFEDEDSWSHF